MPDTEEVQEPEEDQEPENGPETDAEEGSEGAGTTSSAKTQNTVIDFIDGKVRKKTPEEYVRQNIERSLVQEYMYSPGDLAIEHRIKIGSSKKPVDIAGFYEGKERKQENILFIVECKKEGVSPYDRKEGIDQLKSYMAACVNCKFGLWTNGTDSRMCFRRDDSSGTVEFIEIIDIPQKGDELKDVDSPTRMKLRPASGDNLLLAFKRCHNYVAGNQGLQKPEAFWELLKIIFCKIEDERSLEPLAFYITSKEQKSADGQLKAKKRLDTLFTKVKTKYPTIFKPNELIELNRTVTAYVTAQLQGYSLLQSKVDVKGVAYEEIVGTNLRGDRGEFFTPRNACKMAVDLFDPAPGAKIIDPACGTGGFLVTAMNHVLEKFDAAKRKTWINSKSPTPEEISELYRARQELMSTTIVGLDLNPNLVRACKMNMVMNNDGSGGLTQADSLWDPVTWSEQAQAVANLGEFDYLFANPPFGTNIRIDGPEVLEQYDLAAVWDFDATAGRWKKRLNSEGKPVLQGWQPPEILFIERAVQFLKPGTGKMAIVIPNGILNNPPLGYVRQWILENTQVLAVVDMQRDLFQPGNDTQTSMVFLRRKSDSELKKPPRKYPIFMAVTTKIGHDKRGKAVYKRDVDGSDIVVTTETTVQTVEKGKVVEKTIQEKTPIVDDQLPEIPGLYRQWCLEHGL